MRITLKDGVHAGALGYLAPGVVDVPDALATELVAGGRATWIGGRPKAWPDGSRVVSVVSDVVPSGEAQISAADMRAANRHLGCHTAWPLPNVTAASLVTKTWHDTEIVPFEYDAVQIALMHTGTTDLASMIASFASSESLASEVAPVFRGNSFTALAYPGFQSFKWSGSVNAPAIVAPGASVIAYGPWSDMLVAPSLPRTDAGVGRIAMTRLYAPSGASHSRFIASPSAEYLAWTPALAATHGVPYAYRSTWMQAVDAVTVPNAFSAPARRDDMLAHVKRFYFRGRPVSSVMFAGDSRFNTAGATVPTLNAGYNEFSSVPYKVQSILAQRGVSIAVLQCGWSGRTTAQYAAAAVQAIPVLLPSCLAYMVHSVNDSAGDDFDSALITTQIALAEQVRAACEANGVGFIPLCHFPYSGALSGGQLTQAARITAYCASLGVYSNPSALMGNAADNTWRGDVPNDGTHMGELGRTILAADIARCAVEYCPG